MTTGTTWYFFHRHLFLLHDRCQSLHFFQLGWAMPNVKHIFLPNRATSHARTKIVNGGRFSPPGRQVVQKPMDVLSHGHLHLIQGPTLWLGSVHGFVVNVCRCPCGLQNLIFLKIMWGWFFVLEFDLMSLSINFSMNIEENMRRWDWLYYGYGMWTTNKIRAAWFGLWLSPSLICIVCRQIQTQNMPDPSRFTNAVQNTSWEGSTKSGQLSKFFRLSYILEGIYIMYKIYLLHIYYNIIGELSPTRTELRENNSLSSIEDNSHSLFSNTHCIQPTLSWWTEFVLENIFPILYTYVCG